MRKKALSLISFERHRNIVHLPEWSPPAGMLTHAGTDDIIVFISRNGHRKEQT